MENRVELIGFYGGDETHALSAWTSTSHKLTEKRRSRIPAFLKALAENGHETPFEKSLLHFLVTSDVASHIHILKHRIGVSVNAESARYKELKEENRYYYPPDWNFDARAHLAELYAKADKTYHELVDYLEPKLGRKRAKESARFALPYGHQITSDVSFNFRSFVHFLKLRRTPHAQKEINEIAEKMLALVRKIGAFKYSLEAFELA